jgi:hypothetical protein
MKSELKYIKLFEDFSPEEAMMNEAEGGLKQLVGKEKEDTLTSEDAAKIGKKIAEMEGDKLKSYLGMVEALGGYYSGKGDASKEKLTKLREEILSAYHEAKGE